VLKELEAGAKSSLKRDPNLDARQVAEAASKGDELSVSAYRRAGEYLGIAVANFLLHSIHPSLFLAGRFSSRSTIVLIHSGPVYKQEFFIRAIWKSKDRDGCARRRCRVARRAHAGRSLFTGEAIRSL